jgi:hypothetical protein
MNAASRVPTSSTADRWDDLVRSVPLGQFASQPSGRSSNRSRSAPVAIAELRP